MQVVRQSMAPGVKGSRMGWGWRCSRCEGKSRMGNKDVVEVADALAEHIGSCKGQKWRSKPKPSTRKKAVVKVKEPKTRTLRCGYCKAGIVVKSVADDRRVVDADMEGRRWPVRIITCFEDRNRLDPVPKDAPVIEE